MTDSVRLDTKSTLLLSAIFVVALVLLFVVGFFVATRMGIQEKEHTARVTRELITAFMSAPPTPETGAGTTGEEPPPPEVIAEVNAEAAMETASEESRVAEPPATALPPATPPPQKVETAGTNEAPTVPPAPAVAPRPEPLPEPTPEPVAVAAERAQPPAPPPHRTEPVTITLAASEAGTPPPAIKITVTHRPPQAEETPAVAPPQSAPAPTPASAPPRDTAPRPAPKLTLGPTPGPTPGTAEVTAGTVAQAVPEAAPENAPGDAPQTVPEAAADEPPQRFAIQIGTYGERANAVADQPLWQAKGYDTFIYPSTDSRGRTWHTLRTGDFPSKERAAAAAAEFTRREGLKAVSVPVVPEKLPPNHPAATSP